MPGGRPPEAAGAICGANTRKGGFCKLPAGHGTEHVGFGSCKLHSGSTRSGIVAAMEQKIARDVVQYGGPIDIDPHTALLNEVKRTAGHVEWLSDKVRALTDDELIENGIAGKHPQVWIRWYQDERDRLARVASMAIKAGVAERHVQVAEEQGRLLAGAIRVILSGLGLTPEQQRVAPELVRGALMALSSSEGQAA